MRRFLLFPAVFAIALFSLHCGSDSDVSGSFQVSTEMATGVGSTGAILNCRVYMNGSDADVRFTWSLNADDIPNHSSDTLSQRVDADYGWKYVSYPLTGLTPDTVYYFAALAVEDSSVFTSQGKTMFFRTRP